MGGASETNLDPDAVLEATARLAVRADSLKTGISGPAERIRSLHAARPWGDDDAGTAFRTAYLGSSGGGVEAILDGCEGICDAARTLAENVGLSVLETQDQDELLGEHLERSMAQYEGLVDAQNAAIGDVSGRLDGVAADGGGSGTAESGSSGMQSGADADFSSISDTGQLFGRSLGPDPLGVAGGGLYRSVGPEDWGSLAGAADPGGAAVAPAEYGAADAADPDGAGAAAVERDTAGDAVDRDGWPEWTGEPGEPGTRPAGSPDGEVPGATFDVVRADGVAAPGAPSPGAAGAALKATDNVE